MNPSERRAIDGLNIGVFEMPSSKGELTLAGQLDHAGYIYLREFAFAKSARRNWRSDFYIPAGRLLIEIEGISYRGQGTRHQTGVTFQADCEKYNTAAELGYIVIRFTTAMVNGKARRPGKNKNIMDAAIDVIDRMMLAPRSYPADIPPGLRPSGYALQALTGGTVSPPA